LRKRSKSNSAQSTSTNPSKIPLNFLKIWNSLSGSFYELVGVEGSQSFGRSYRWIEVMIRLFRWSFGRDGGKRIS